jgi:hypothetical protein
LFLSIRKHVGKAQEHPADCVRSSFFFFFFGTFFGVGPKQAPTANQSSTTHDPSTHGKPSLFFFFFFFFYKKGRR